MACGVLADMLTLDTEVASLILGKFSSGAAIANLQQLMDMNRPRSDMRKIDGTNFGCPYLGYFDHPIAMLQRLLTKYSQDLKQNKPVKGDLFQALNQNNICDSTMAFLVNLSSKTELSPKGFISLMNFVYDAIGNNLAGFLQKFFKNCLKLFCSFLREDQLLSVQEWPQYSGGGSNAATLITT